VPWMEADMPKKPHREPLDPVWAKSLLSVPSKHSEGKTVAECLEKLRGAFTRVVAEAREHVEGHPFTEVLAAEQTRRLGRRGEATLVVGDDGVVYLEVHYKGQQKRDPEAPKRPWQSSLPALSGLKEQAQALGIDPAPFGRSKTRLVNAIEQAQNTKPKRQKTAPAIGPVTVIETKPEPKTPTPSKLDRAQAMENEFDSETLQEEAFDIGTLLDRD